MNFDVKHNQRVHINWSIDNPKNSFLKTPTTRLVPGCFLLSAVAQSVIAQTDEGTAILNFSAQGTNMGMMLGYSATP